MAEKTSKLKRLRHFASSVAIHSLFGELLHPLWERAWPAVGGTFVSAVVALLSLHKHYNPLAYAALGFFFAFLFMAILGMALRKADATKSLARQVEAVARTARGVIREGRWVWGPPTAEGRGHTHFDFLPHLQAFDRATVEYLAEDRDKVRSYYEKIREATSLPDRVIWPELEVLLDKLAAWTDSRAPRHPLD